MRHTRDVVMAAGLFLALLAPTAALAQDVYYDYDTPPLSIKITRPEYPLEAREKRIEGVVILEITITTEGKVVHPVVIQSVEGLDQAAVDCVCNWLFKPAEKDGRLVPAMARAPIAFRLPDPPTEQDEV